MILGASLFSQSPTATPVTAANDSDTERAILRAQLKLMQDYDERLLSTVHWSLATIAGIAVLLVGFSWFSNYRIAEKDKAVLAQELSTRVKEEVSRIEKNFDERTRTHLTAVDTKAKESVKSAVEGAVSSLDGHIQSLQRSVQDLNYEARQMKAHYWELKDVKGNELTQYREMGSALI